MCAANGLGGAFWPRRGGRLEPLPTLRSADHVTPPSISTSVYKPVLHPPTANDHDERLGRHSLSLRYHRPDTSLA